MRCILSPGHIFLFSLSKTDQFPFLQLLFFCIASSLERIIPQTKEAEGVTEALKAANQMEWVGLDFTEDEQHPQSGGGNHFD